MVHTVKVFFIENNSVSGGMLNAAFSEINLQMNKIHIRKSVIVVNIPNQAKEEKTHRACKLF